MFDLAFPESGVGHMSNTSPKFRSLTNLTAESAWSVGIHVLTFPRTVEEKKVARKRRRCDMMEKEKEIK